MVIRWSTWAGSDKHFQPRMQASALFASCVATPFDLCLCLHFLFANEVTNLLTYVCMYFLIVSEDLLTPYPSPLNNN